ncbi:hypothetical protein VL10_14840 [Leclercia adecarboxylata]|nr:hypothetical protein VL10_14840 [Leclercia adecarboxylata]KMN63708.1 hypothetical protein VK95_18615 [Leclercia sp. LK8]
MSGRARFTIEARDTICRAIGVYPGEILLQRPDLKDNNGFIDIRTLPEKVQEAMRCITDSLISRSRPRRITKT